MLEVYIKHTPRLLPHCNRQTIKNLLNFNVLIKIKDCILGYSENIDFLLIFCILISPIHFMLYFKIYLMGISFENKYNIFLIPKNAFLTFQFY